MIVDATFLRRADRDSFRALARDTGVAFSILAPRATPEQLRERILARKVLGQDASEATLDVLAQQMRTLEPLGPDEALDGKLSTDHPYSNGCPLRDILVRPALVPDTL